MENTSFNASSPLLLKRNLSLNASSLLLFKVTLPTSGSGKQRGVLDISKWGNQDLCPIALKRGQSRELKKKNAGKFIAHYLSKHGWCTVVRKNAVTGVRQRISEDLRNKGNISSSLKVTKGNIIKAHLLLSSKMTG
jgi:hypothetical protein